jgi:hypothetical protein
VRLSGTARLSLVNAKLLIDAIVRQTTVLIAQLSTAAGARSPLAHVADQVFFELSRELEAQGLGKRVVADMFGMLLRGYQKKVQRLAESASVRDKSLWQAVFEFIVQSQSITRSRVFERFAHDEEEAVASVLHDLSTSGLVFATGQGRATLYRAASEADRLALLDATDLESVVQMVWVSVFHNPGTNLGELTRLLNVDVGVVERALIALRTDDRVTGTPEWSELKAEELLVPVGSEVGWEAAVLDHYQAMASAIITKLRKRMLRAESTDAVGGATLRFELSKTHPYAEEVYALLPSTRHRANELWERVREYNERHPLDESEKIRACFYFGQSVLEPNDEN